MPNPIPSQYRHNEIFWPQWYLPLFFGLLFFGLVSIESTLAFAKLTGSTRISMIPAYVLRGGFLFLCLFGIVFAVRKHRVSAPVFHIPLLYVAFWCLYSIRYAYECFTHTGPLILGNQFDYLRPFTMLALMWMPLLVCATGIPEKLSGKTIYCILIPLVIVNATLFYLLFDFISQGVSGRSLAFEDAPRLDLGFPVVGTFSRYGCVLGVLSFWAWSRMKLSTPFFLILYFLGQTMMFYGETRLFFIVNIVASLFILVFSGACREQKYRMIVFLLMIGLNAGIGFHMRSGIRERISHEALNVTQAYKDILTTPMAPEDLRSIESGLETIPSEENIVSDEPPAALIPASTPAPASVPAPVESIDPQTIKTPREFYRYYKNQPPGLLKIGSSRLLLWYLAFEQVKANPLTGTGSYVAGLMPHNNIVEAFLATGVIGGTIFVVILIIGLRDACLFIRRYPAAGWLPVIFVICFFHQLFGTRLSENAMLWCSMAAMHATLYFGNNSTGDAPATPATEETGS